MAEESIESLKAQIRALEERVAALEKACDPVAVAAAVSKQQSRLGV